MKRDQNNDIYFGMNSETSYLKAFDSEPGPYKVVMGFSNSMKGDVFELLELNTEKKSYK